MRKMRKTHLTNVVICFPTTTTTISHNNNNKEANFSIGGGGYLGIYAI